MPRRAAVVIAYAVLTAVMTWPFVNYGHFADSSYGGDARLIIWTTAWANHAVLNGLPLFDANIFFPAPESLRYNEHLLGVSLATLPWAAAGASPVLAYNATWWLAFFLNGLAAFAWLRRFAIDALPAFVGSLVFACSFYVMLHAHGHLHLIWLWPLPLSALLLERWFVTPTVWRAAVWLAVVLMGLLTSWYVAVMVALVNAIVFALLIVASPASRAGGVWKRRAVHLGTAAVIAGAIVYPIARPYVGLRANPAEAAAFSADVEAYLVPPENTIAGRLWRANVDARPRSIYGETTLFAGWIAIGLGVVGLVALLTDRRVPKLAWVFPALAAAGFLLSLGPCAAAAGRARARAIRLAGEPSGLLRHAGTSAVRARLHAGAVGPDGAWRVVGVGAGGATRAPGPGRAGSADAARVVRGGLPRRQARGASDSGDLPDARGPLRARDRVAARVSRPAGLVPGRRLPVLLDRALAADRQRIRPQRAAESAGGRREDSRLRVGPGRRRSAGRAVRGRARGPSRRARIAASSTRPGRIPAFGSRAQIGSDYLFENRHGRLMRSPTTADGSPVGGGAWSSRAGGPSSSVKIGFSASAHTW